MYCLESGTEIGTPGIQFGTSFREREARFGMQSGTWRQPQPPLTPPAGEWTSWIPLQSPHILLSVPVSNTQRNARESSAEGHPLTPSLPLTSLRYPPDSGSSQPGTGLPHPFNTPFRFSDFLFLYLGFVPLSFQNITFGQKSYTPNAVIPIRVQMACV